eukprot:UN00183
MACCFKSITTVISTPDGRDKAHALLEKPAKIALYLLTTRKASPELVERLTTFSYQIMLARGINRLFSGAYPIEALLNSSNDTDVPSFVRYAKMLIALSWIGFFYYDNKIFFGLSGLSKNVDYPTAGVRASRFWFFCLLLTLILRGLHVSSLDDSDESKENQKLIKNTKSKMLCGVMEILCAARGSGFISFNDGVHEALMLGSTLVGIKRILS